MGIYYSPFVFAGGADCDLKFNLITPDTLPLGALRPSGTAYGQFYRVAKSIESKTLTTLENYALYDCLYLESVTLPNLTTVGQYALGTSSLANGNATTLITLNLPKVQTIGNYAFRWRTTLTSVTLGSPSNPVTSIGATAFNGCSQSGLTIIIYTADGSALDNSPFGATSATVTYRGA